MNLSKTFCYLFFGQWRWDLIGIGTLISMVYVGVVVRLVSPHSEWLTRYLFGKEQEKEDDSTEQLTPEQAPLIITIARQFGSGGHAIGEKLAQQLHMDFYDYKLIQETAEKLGYSNDFVQANEQRISNSKLVELILTDKQVPQEMIYSREDAIFVAQSRIIRQVATQKPAVIIGRCADYILKNHPKCFRVFVYANVDNSAQRVSQKEHISMEQARQRIHQTNQERANHYWQYTGHKWGEAEQYDMVLNTSHISIDKAVELIACAIKER